MANNLDSLGDGDTNGVKTSQETMSFLGIVAAALLLLLAGGLKAYQLAEGPTPQSGPFSSRRFAFFVVHYEWLLGLWMLSSVMRKLACWTATITFLLFSFISLVHVVRGDQCGCFGTVEIPTSFLLALDLTIFCLLAASRKHWNGKEVSVVSLDSLAKKWRRIAVMVALMVFASGMTVWWTISSGPASLNEVGEVVGSGLKVELYPNRWSGRWLPLLHHVDGDALSTGEWEVWIYRNKCPHCHQLLETLDEREHQKKRLALLQLPPHEPQKTRANATHFQVSDQYKWRVRTPVIVHLVEGVVESVEQPEFE